MRVKLWLKNALITAAAGLAGAAVYALMMFLMNGDFEPERFLNMTSGYLVGIGVVMMVLIGIMDYKVTLPLALSFGSTRKEALVGMQLGRLAAGLLLAGVSAVLFVVKGGWEVPFFVLGVLILCGGVGAALGMLIVRYGKAAGIAAGIVLMVIAAGATFATITVIAANGFEWMGLWLVPAVGAVVYGLVLLAEIRTLRNYNVKL